jgi:hypothetical protein
MMSPRLAPAVLSCSFWFLCGCPATAFIDAPHRLFCGHERRIALHRHTIVINAALNNDDDTEKSNSESQPPSEGAAMSLDQQKLSLENMMKSISDKTEIPVRRTSVLTTSRRQRLEREIELLKRLDPAHRDNNVGYSDLQNQELVVSELWSLWYGERGPLNERKLHEIEEQLVDPSQWPDAEKKYLNLIREHCCGADGSVDHPDLSNWVEPANRLATLLFLMGRLSESKQWCERILIVKPWHIGALSGIVMVCMKLSDKEGAIKYSLMGLPNLSPQMRSARDEWVRRNVQLAEKNLSRLEELNRVAYGESDEIHARDSSDVKLDAKTKKLEDGEGMADSEWQ